MEAGWTAQRARKDQSSQVSRVDRPEPLASQNAAFVIAPMHSVPVGPGLWRGIRWARTCIGIEGRASGSALALRVAA